MLWLLAAITASNDSCSGMEETTSTWLCGFRRIACSALTVTIGDRRQVGRSKTEQDVSGVGATGACPDAQEGVACGGDEVGNADHDRADAGADGVGLWVA